MSEFPLIVGFQPLSHNNRNHVKTIVRGDGIYLYDSSGKKFIEATSSFWVAALGFQNEELISSIEKQYRKLPFLVSGMHRTTDTSIELSEKLASISVIDDPAILFAATGSEANDFLIKMFKYGASSDNQSTKMKFVSRRQSYHGGTLASASLTGGHHSEFGLPLSGFCHVSQPDFHGDRFSGETEEEFCKRLISEVENLIVREDPNSIAAFFAEPVSFSAGLHVPPKNYFSHLKELLSYYEIDLIADEVVTGFGRTGKMWGSESVNFAPDHSTMGKGITSGYFPLSAIAIGKSLYDRMKAKSKNIGSFAHAATYAAHPVGAAAALKTLEIIKREKLLEHSAEMGRLLEAELRPLGEHPMVGDIRCHGLAAAIDFRIRDEDDKLVEVDPTVPCNKIYEELIDHGLITRPVNGSLLIAPPLITTRDQIFEISDKICSAFKTFNR